jgi:anti-sigma factor RsiW
MELTDQQYEQIQLYIQGKLSGSQLTEMEQLIAQNPDYAQAVADERILLKAIEQDARKTLKNRFDALHTQMDKETVASSPTQRSFFLRYAAAASVVLLLGVGWFLWNYPSMPISRPQPHLWQTLNLRQIPLIS